MPEDSDADRLAQGRADFRTTHWSQVLEARREGSAGAEVALEQLCRTYWYPIYVYVRRLGCNPDDSKDLTQEFFARLLRLNSLRDVSREKGKFRTFLLASLHHFLSDARKKDRAAKRGGGKELLSLDDEDAERRYAGDLSVNLSPEKLFDRRWALTVLGQAMERLESEFVAADKTRQFMELKPFLSTEAAPGAYEMLGPKLDMTPRAVGTAVWRLRQRYTELVRAEVANTVTGPAELNAEFDYLLEVAGQ